ncbi:MAG: beta-ketoacyl synthase [Pseudomonadales bacterium]|nr:beta-ketoacyl synthase [Pseudomonadales bacterium]
MARLPVIVGFGGISPAGRSSLHHGYRRLVLDRLTTAAARETRLSLATLMGLVGKRGDSWTDQFGDKVDLDPFLDAISDRILEGTLIRRLEKNLFDPDHIPFHKSITLSGRNTQPVEFVLSRRHLPEPLPEGWQVSDDPDHPGKLHVVATDHLEVLLSCQRESDVNTAGQLPSGFDPEVLYPARSHPRGLQMTVFAASDAINSLGIDWQTVTSHVAPDQVSVYAGSGMSQLDYNGFGGLLQARLCGRKVTSKQLPLGYAEMPADFVNAYILGNLGTTGTNVAACATFLYNLRQGIRDIQSGTHRVAIIGTSEAPLVAEIFDGFTTMGALADDNKLRELDGLSRGERPFHRRACRPFGTNVGFTLAESAQFVVLFDDQLALELGAPIHGAVNDVFVNADGFKKSIAGPGVGNYLTMAKAAAATRNLLGEQGLRERTYVQAHGTGTPQNRTTESRILSRVAETFGIHDWPVTAVKSYLGHSLASAAGDQLVTSLGVWRYGFIPGITTIGETAGDVHTDGLDILLQHKEVDADSIEAVIINSKGFGGNNASASVLSPVKTEQLLTNRYGTTAMSAYRQRRESALQRVHDYDTAASSGNFSTTYQFGENVLDDADIELNSVALKVRGRDPEVSLQVPDHYREYLQDRD